MQGVNAKNQAAARAALLHNLILQSIRRVHWPHTASTSRRPPLLWQPDSGHRLCAEPQGGSVVGPSRGCLRRRSVLPLRVWSVKCWKLSGGGAGHVYPAQMRKHNFVTTSGGKSELGGGVSGSLGAPRHASASWSVHQQPIGPEEKYLASHRAYIVQDAPIQLTICSRVFVRVNFLALSVADGLSGVALGHARARWKLHHVADVSRPRTSSAGTRAWIYASWRLGVQIGDSRRRFENGEMQTSSIFFYTESSVLPCQLLSFVSLVISYY